MAEIDTWEYQGPRKVCVEMIESKRKNASNRYDKYSKLSDLTNDIVNKLSSIITKMKCFENEIDKSYKGNKKFYIKDEVSKIEEAIEIMNSKYEEYVSNKEYYDASIDYWNNYNIDDHYLYDVRGSDGMMGLYRIERFNKSDM